MSIDMACTDWKIAIECDGPSHYLTVLDGSGQSVENYSTKAKRRLLQRLGWKVVNLNWEEAARRQSSKKWLRGQGVFKGASYTSSLSSNIKLHGILNLWASRRTYSLHVRIRTGGRPMETRLCCFLHWRKSLKTYTNDFCRPQTKTLIKRVVVPKYRSFKIPHAIIFTPAHVYVILYASASNASSSVFLGLPH